MELIRPLLEIVGGIVVVYWFVQGAWWLFARWQYRRHVRARLEGL